MEGSRTLQPFHRPAPTMPPLSMRPSCVLSVYSRIWIGSVSTATNAPEPLGGQCTVDCAVVDGEREPHDRPDG